MIKYLNMTAQDVNCGSRALFCDRDGTLIYNRHYLADPAGVEIVPGAVDWLKKFQAAGYVPFIISNQSGIARGYFTEDDLWAVHVRTLDVFREQGIEFSGCYYCPHGPEEGCGCRKPAPGMLLEAVHDFHLDLAGSVMIGDSDVDVKVGENAGIVSVKLPDGDWNVLNDFQLP